MCAEAGVKLFILVGLGRGFFVCCLAHRGSAVGFLLLRCSGGVVRRPGGLRVSVAPRFCRVLVFASSWCLSVICLFSVVVRWWVGGLRADRVAVCFEPWWRLGAGLGARGAGLGPPVFLYWPFQGGVSFVVPCCSCCLCLCFGSSVVLVACLVGFGWLGGRLFGGGELFVLFAAGAFREL